MLVFLIGFMGSGKTTVGEKLAKTLNYNFIDLDKQIEQAVNKSIADLFAHHGEKFFRESEKTTLHQSFEQKNTVISCGGGTPCFFDNLEQMKKNGITVYLKLAAGSLFHRLAAGKSKRPLISGMTDLGLMEYITNELEKRELFYNQADIIIKGESIKASELAEMIKNFSNSR